MKSWSPSAATGASTRGRLIDVEQITRTLAFLGGYRPATVDAAPADDPACEAPRPPMNGRMEREDSPEPYCTACGSAAGIFLGHGPDWHHFRAPDAGHAGDQAEVYTADHAPVVGWRYPARPACADRACHDRPAT